MKQWWPVILLNNPLAKLGLLTALLWLVGCSSKPLAIDTRTNGTAAISALSGDVTRNPFPVDDSQPIFEVALVPVSLLLAPAIEDKANGGAPLVREDGNGYPILVLQVGFSDAWEQLLLAVSSSRLRVKDNDRSQGIIFLDEVAGGVFSGIKNKRTSKAKRYQLSVTKTQLGTEVSVQFSSDELADIEASNAILNEINDNLSQ